MQQLFLEENFFENQRTRCQYVTCCFKSYVQLTTHAIENKKIRLIYSHIFGLII